MPYGKILLLEEGTRLRRLITEALQQVGMEVFSTSRIDAYSLSEAERADVVLLDSGLCNDSLQGDICMLRGARAVPVILLAELGDDLSEQQLSQCGADRIISKPFAIGRLVELTAEHLKINKPKALDSKVLSFKGLEVDIKSYTVSVDGICTELAPKEIELLYLMMSQPERPFSRSELSSNVWGRILDDNRTLTVHINKLRRKLASYGECIKSVRGIGYMFSANGYK